MPNKPPRPCPGRGPRRGGCPNLIRGNEKCCPECQKYEKQATRDYDRQRDESAGRQFLHSATWRRIAAAKLSRDPLCEECLQAGRVEPASLVHHRDRNELNNDPSNHESMCNNCHEIEHKPERFRKGEVNAKENNPNP